MHRDTALGIIKKKIDRDFESITAAAKALGVDRSNLSVALNAHLKDIPQYLLDYAGLEAVRPVVTYRKKSGAFHESH